jgi:hypothetical protein
MLLASLLALAGCGGGGGSGGGDGSGGGGGIPDIPAIFDISQENGQRSAWVVTERSAPGAIQPNPVQYYVFTPDSPGAVSAATFTGSEFLDLVQSPLDGSFVNRQIQFTVHRVPPAPGAPGDVSFQGVIRDSDTIVVTSGGETLTLRRQPCPTASCEPSIAITSPSLSFTAGGEGATFTAAPFGSDDPVGWSLDGPGSISTTAGTATDYTPPDSVAGNTTASLSATAGRLSTTVTITIRPPGTPPPSPDIDSVVPTTGSILGGDTVTLTGTDFTPGAAVSFGGAPATVQEATATAIEVITPARSAGTVDVTVTNPDGQVSTLPSGFTFQALELASLEPSAGCPAGGEVLTLTGTAFVEGTTVALGGAEAELQSVKDTTIVLSAPAREGPGTVSVTVSSPDGQSFTLDNAYTYQGLTLTSVEPNTGPWTGGTEVTLTGTCFVEETAVAFFPLCEPRVFGCEFAVRAEVQSVDSMTIEIITSEFEPGTMDVVVSNPDGQFSILEGAFTYVPPPPPVTP